MSIVTHYMIKLNNINVVSDRQATNRLHTGKEFLPFQGVALYDNQARYYDPIGSKFLTMDPLCEKYPSLSPYSHCANNPLSIIDPTGRELVYSEEMTEDQQNSLNSSLDALKGSQLFSTIYNKLDKSPNRYTVQFGETVKVNENDYAPGQFAPNSDGGGTITFNENMEMALSTTAEEYYHAYQTEVPSSFDNITNLEFEAKVFAMGASYEAGVLSKLPFLDNIYNIISERSEFMTTFPMLNSEFQSDYLSIGNSFANKYESLGIKNYSKPVLFMPFRLQNVISQSQLKF